MSIVWNDVPDSGGGELRVHRASDAVEHAGPE
jgi:hypothetical protein